MDDTFSLPVRRNMTKREEKDLFIDWSLYEPRSRRAMIEEYTLYQKFSSSSSQYRHSKWSKFLN